MRLNNSYGSEKLYSFDLEKQQENINKFLIGVYNWMAMGLAITGFISWIIGSREDLVGALVQNTGLFYGLIILELAMVFGFVFLYKKVSYPVAMAMFLAYAAINGVTLSVIFMIYTMESIATTFYVTGGTFAAMSAFGYFTKRDLSGVGHFAFMGLIGVIIASIVNIFMASSTLYWLITYAGILVFVLLTAYDTQKLKRIGAGMEEGMEETSKASIYGALILYLDFINLFLYLLRLLGDRK